MTFGEKIKLVRYKLYLSQEDIARKIGMAFSTVNRWERGHALPSFKAQAKFDKFCKDNGILFNDNGII